MTALLIRIIPCQITRWVKPHPYVLLKVGTGVYGCIGAELDDTNMFNFSMIGQAVLLPFEVQDRVLSPAYYCLALPWSLSSAKSRRGVS